MWRKQEELIVPEIKNNTEVSYLKGEAGSSSSPQPCTACTLGNLSLVSASVTLDHK